MKIPYLLLIKGLTAESNLIPLTLAKLAFIEVYMKYNVNI